jgi:hypothetical protein
MFYFFKKKIKKEKKKKEKKTCCRGANPTPATREMDYPVNYKCRGIFVFSYFLRQKCIYTTINWILSN